MMDKPPKLGRDRTSQSLEEIYQTTHRQQGPVKVNQPKKWDSPTSLKLTASENCAKHMFDSRLFLEGVCRFKHGGLVFDANPEMLLIPHMKMSIRSSSTHLKLQQK